MRSPSPLASLPRSLRALSVHSARHVMSISSLDFLVWHAPTFLELFPRLLGVQNIPLYRFVVLLPVKQADQFHIRLCGLAFGLWAIQRFVRHPGLGHVGGCRLAANKLSVTVNMQLPTSGQDSDEHRQNSSRACRPASAKPERGSRSCRALGPARPRGTRSGAGSRRAELPCGPACGHISGRGACDAARVRPPSPRPKYQDRIAPARRFPARRPPRPGAHGQDPVSPAR